MFGKPSVKQKIKPKVFAVICPSAFNTPMDLATLRRPTETVCCRRTVHLHFPLLFHEPWDITSLNYPFKLYSVFFVALLAVGSFTVLKWALPGGMFRTVLGHHWAAMFLSIQIPGEVWLGSASLTSPSPLSFRIHSYYLQSRYTGFYFPIDSCVFHTLGPAFLHLHLFPPGQFISVTESCPTLCNPHGLYSPWNSPGQNAGVNSLSLLQGIFPTQVFTLQADSLPAEPHKGSPRILECIAYPFSSRSSRPRNQTGVSCITGGFFTHWAIREALKQVI